MDEVKQIQEILALFEKHHLSELSLESGEFKLSLKSGKYPAPGSVQILPQAGAEAPTLAAAPSSAAPAPFAAPAPASAGAPETPAGDVLASADFASAVAEAFEAGDLAAQQRLAEQAGWTPIKSPMMGTFYAAPKPDAPPFCSKGDLKKKGQVLCIIEAMKMMNELPAPADCEIEQIAVKDGQIIEYGQILFWVAKA